MSSYAIEKAIQIAVKNGWNDGIAADINRFNMKPTMEHPHETPEYSYKARDSYVVMYYKRPWYSYTPKCEFVDITSFIFAHSFAQALWGSPDSPIKNVHTTGIVWKTHLAQMVLADDIAAYLEMSV